MALLSSAGNNHHDISTFPYLLSHYIRVAVIAESAWIRFSCVVVVPLHFVHYAFLARFTLSEYNSTPLLLHAV